MEIIENVYIYFICFDWNSAQLILGNLYEAPAKFYDIPRFHDKEAVYDFKKTEPIKSWNFGVFMMVSENGNIFHFTGPLCREFTSFLVNSPHKGQWRRALILSFICIWINGWLNNCEAGDLRSHHAHYDVIAVFVEAFPAPLQRILCRMKICIHDKQNGKSWQP